MTMQACRRKSHILLRRDEGAAGPSAAALQASITNLQATLRLPLPDGGMRARKRISELQAQLQQAKAAEAAEASARHTSHNARTDDSSRPPAAQVSRLMSCHE